MSRVLTSGQAITIGTEARARQRAIAEDIQVRQIEGTAVWIASSGSDPQRAYALTIRADRLISCSCKAGEFGAYCKHRAAFEIAREQQEAIGG